jgi:outer membrane biosynthesis protein TonB
VMLALGAVLFALRDRLGLGSDGSGGVPVAEEQRAPEPSSVAGLAPSPTPAPIGTPTPQPTPSPTPEPTPVPSPMPSPTPQPTPEPTPAPTPEPTPEPTPRPTPVPAPPPTPPPAIIARAIDSASLRNVPSTDGTIVGYAQVGSTATVVGCSAGCSWLQVATPSGVLWSARHFWSVSGDISRVPAR